MASRLILSHKQTKYRCTSVAKSVAVAGERLAAGATLLLSLIPRHRKNVSFFLVNLCLLYPTDSWLQPSQAGLTLSTMTVKAACLNLQGSLN